MKLRSCATPVVLDAARGILAASARSLRFVPASVTPA